MSQSVRLQMASLSKRLQQSNLGVAQYNLARGSLISEKEIDAAATRWKDCLIGKIISPDDIEFDKVQKDFNIIWRRHKKVEINIMGRNMYVFKFKTDDDMTDVLKRFPWIIYEHLLVMKPYDNSIPLEEKIVNDGENGFTKRGRAVSAKTEVDLRQPLKRGNWLLTAAKQKVWIRYHFEKQPRQICTKCFTIDHDKEQCAERAWNIFIFVMTKSAFEAYYAKHAHLVENMQNSESNAAGNNTLTLANGNGPESSNEEDDPRKFKRSRDSGIEDNYVLLDMNNQNPNIPRREITQQIISGGGGITEIGENSHGGYDLNMEDAENGGRDPINGEYHLPTTELISHTANQRDVSAPFQGKNLNHHVTTRIALKLVNETDTYLSNPAPENNLRIVTEEENLNSVISQLPEKCHIIFSDEAFDKNSNLSDIGLVMNDITGSFLGCKLKAGNVRNAEEVESLALLETVKWAKEKDLEKVCFVSDAKKVIDSFNFNNNQLFWYNNSFLDDSKISRRSRTSGEWMGFIPEFLNSISFF
ncbi:hypothetical protein C5167_042721 [Papaver somniferum]|uniref:DUF4283 domain-containing protein n=1 Tax=Papaver somniferum TaxID=3469 RepID=A0A4Y7L7J3_PAPSO|nr:hypothetical protein C5167_042721 [Papaver somniferum]